MAKRARILKPKSLPSLSLIGVPDSMQARGPFAASYPQRFNSDARNIWDKMFQDADFVSAVKSRDTVEDQWYWAITEFLKRCGDEGVLPFLNVTQQEKNDAAINSLSQARQSLVHFVDGINLFEKVKIQKAYFNYILKDNGFKIRAWATLRPNFDPLFVKWLRTAPLPRFLPVGDDTYGRMITPNVHMWVRYLNGSRISLGYDIDIGSQVSVPGKRLATRKEVDSFIDRVIWKPIVRGHRFKQVKNRLF